MFDFLNLGVYLTAQIRVFKCQLLDGKIFILLSIVLSIQTEYTEFCQEERNHSKNKEISFLSMVGSSFILYYVLSKPLFCLLFGNCFHTTTTLYMSNGIYFPPCVVQIVLVTQSVIHVEGPISARLVILR